MNSGVAVSTVVISGRELDRPPVEVIYPGERFKTSGFCAREKPYGFGNLTPIGAIFRAIYKVFHVWKLI
jgi:hypothetical protein